MEKRQIPFSPPDITELEIAEVVKTLKSGWITTGPRTKLFERKIAEYCGTARAVALNSATACLEAILRFLKIGEGDEVITSAYTYTASASPICHVGAKLVFVDVAKDSFEMDYDALEKAVTERTKAIIPVDVGGVLCDYSRIFDIVERKRGLFHPKNEIQEAIGRVAVVADSAHAFGAKRRVEGNWRKCGSIADFTSFSFHAVKNLTTAEGGALTWNPIKGIDDDWIYQQFMLYSLHGQSKDALAKSQLGAWEYDIVSPAYKCNMTDIMAAIGLGQLSRYSELLEIRKEIIDRYDSAFLSMGMQGLKHFGDDHVSSGHLYLLRMAGMTEKERNYFICRLAEEGVAANVHYKPLPMMTAYMELGFNIVDYPNAFRQYQNEITLPLHTCLSQEDVEYVVTKVRELLGRQGALKYAV
ncbi:MAG: DegT/DnrJ/EryC1/StrS aminotransferase family protein [Dorea sp.]|nr:DegT/DnrJ/EryC1/StrS aminotransferase family protein [Dorea sp.]